MCFNGSSTNFELYGLESAVQLARAESAVTVLFLVAVFA